MLRVYQTELRGGVCTRGEGSRAVGVQETGRGEAGREELDDIREIVSAWHKSVKEDCWSSANI